MFTSLNENKRHAAVEVLKEETMEYPWESITFVEYSYPFNNEEFIGTLIEVSEPNGRNRYYNRVWRERGENCFNWKHYLRFQRKFIRDIAYRSLYEIPIGESADFGMEVPYEMVIGKLAE